MKFAAMFVVWLLSLFPACAQDQCVALLQGGIFNTVQSLQAGSSASTIQNQICSSYNSYKSGTLKADASGNYELISSGSASFTKDEVESIGQAMCTSGYTNDQASSQITNFSSIVSAEATKAFDDCMNNSRIGLIVDTQFDPSAPELVTITARYDPVGNAGKQYVSPVDITSSATSSNQKVTCSGTLVDAGKKHKQITSAALTMTCRRPIENDPQNAFPIAGHTGGIAFPATVTVPTTVAPITYLFGSIFMPPPPSPIVSAVGDVVMSLLGSTDFAKQHVGQSWILCDGSTTSAPVGSAWATITGNAPLPDCSGRFPRAHSSLTPAVGGTQEDTLQPHTHYLDNVTIMWQSNADAGHTSTLLAGDPNHGGSLHTFGIGPQGNTDAMNETRPKAVVFNFYIRVN